MESSPGKYHVYWLVSDCPLESFPPAQKALAAKYGGDPVVHDLTRVMRLPGFFHQKKEPFLTRIIHENPCLPYAMAEIISGLGLELGNGESRTPPMHGIGHDPILAALDAKGLVKRQLTVGKWDLICPWVGEHTDGLDNGTAYFESNFNGYSGAGFKCQHTHCADRGIEDLREFLGVREPFEIFLDSLPKAVSGVAVEEYEQEVIPWPVLPDAALIGIVGDVVRLATLDSEADPAAVLLTTLARAGATIGSGVFTTVGDTVHTPRLFTVLVGASSRSRKGTSYSPVEKVFRATYERFLVNGNAPFPLGLDLTISYGPLSSGEGLVHAVRDASETLDKEGKPIDPGVDDKRLFVIEGEFGAVLKAAQRDGNTLSAILRSAWDHGNIQPLTKHNRIKATGAHVNFTGHITSQELHVLLQSSDIWNGFANRILWGTVKRTKHVPFPVAIPPGDLAEISTKLEVCIRHAYSDPDHPRLFDQAAAGKWGAIYESLTEDRAGVLGAVTSRSEAQVLRLALLYSALDPHASMIEVQHLKAAVAVWQFCDESAR
ncbi:MAG: DNA-primase RepB domain-containing protein, partial [Gammaproteobacteria bacterium]